MFLVFTGFSARLGMTVTDKRSHGGRVQEQGEIARETCPHAFCPASQRIT